MQTSRNVELDFVEDSRWYAVLVTNIASAFESAMLDFRYFVADINTFGYMTISREENDKLRMKNNIRLLRR